MPKRRASAIYVPDSDEEQQQIQAARGEAEPLPAMTSPRAAKRGRASPAKAKKPPQEKRLSRYRPAPSMQTLTRMDRALSRGAGAAHRLFLIEHKQVTGEDHDHGRTHQFVVLGATGNVYTVTLAQQPGCTCPDFQRRGEPCKHMLFVMLRVLKLDSSNPLAWQKALLKQEVADILAGVHSAGGGAGGSLGGITAGQEVLERYKTLTGGAGASRDVQQRLDGDCSICFEDLGGEDTVYCSTSCGNSFHSACFRRWREHARQRAEAVTCPLCRGAWAEPGDGGGGGADATDSTQQQPPPAYVNLASSSSAHARADLSMQALYGDTSQHILMHQRRQAALGL